MSGKGTGPRLLFLFLDGVGLGTDNPMINPFAGAAMPNLRSLLGGQPLVASAAPIESPRATLLPLDACLGVPGAPQSATGQATLLTGRNVPAELGYHYGPKPNPPSPRFCVARTARTPVTCSRHCGMPASGVRCSTPTLRATLRPSSRAVGSTRPSRWR
jgi:hypothetical protein